MKNIFTIKTRIHDQVEEVDWQNVYDDSLPKIYHYFCYKVGDPILAEDLSAMTFEKAWISRRNFHSDVGEVQSWLMGIARNVANDYFRKKMREVPFKEGSEQNLISFFDDQIQEKLDFEFILSILERLPERERDLIASLFFLSQSRFMQKPWG